MSGQQAMLGPEATDQWLWIVVVGAFGSFFCALGIGANDVANSFATSVGARAVTLRQAIILAGFSEFLGAVLLGMHVAKAIREDVADVTCFLENPAKLMYGMMCVAYTTAVWLLLASYLELPVSSTHSTIGSIVGMTVVHGGPRCVMWRKESGSFPYSKGVAAMVVSWFLSPLCAGVVSLLGFLTVRTFVLRSSHAFGRSFWVLPFLAMVVIAANAFAFIYKGERSLNLHETGLLVSLSWSLGLGCGIALFLVPVTIPAVRKKLVDYHRRRVVPHASSSPEGQDVDGGGLGSVMYNDDDREGPASVETSDNVGAIHGDLEKFDPRAEEVLKYAQVVSAMCDSFAHGANDVGNAMGPFEVIYMVYMDGNIQNHTSLGPGEYIILALGGLAMVLGLAAYGHKLITSISVNIRKITPSRGFSIQLGAATVLILGTRLELPLSSTHCQVGATAGVALLEETGGLNIWVLVKIMLGWAVTMIICGVCCALLFALGACTPWAFDSME